MQRVIVSVAAFVVLVLSVSVAATAQSFSSGSTGANGFVTVLLISVAPIVSAQSQKPLTNEDVVKMVAAGLPESTIVQVIQKGPMPRADALQEQLESNPDLLRVPNLDVITAHQAGLSDASDPDLLAWAAVGGVLCGRIQIQTAGAGIGLFERI